jgi:hypothetical protein
VGVSEFDRVLILSRLGSPSWILMYLVLKERDRAPVRWRSVTARLPPDSVALRCPGPVATRRRTPCNVVGLSEQRSEEAHDAQEDDDPDDDDGDQRKIRNQNQPLGLRGCHNKGGNLRPNRTAAELISRSPTTTPCSRFPAPRGVGVLTCRDCADTPPAKSSRSTQNHNGGLRTWAVFGNLLAQPQR